MAKENKIYAHGAVKAVRIVRQKRKWPKLSLEFGSTAAVGYEYPVAFYGLENIKKLHAWLTEQIQLLETEGGDLD